MPVYFLSLFIVARRPSPVARRPSPVARRPYTIPVAEYNPSSATDRISAGGGPMSATDRMSGGGGPKSTINWMSCIGGGMKNASAAMMPVQSMSIGTNRGAASSRSIALHCVVSRNKPSSSSTMGSRALTRAFFAEIFDAE